MAVSNLGLYGVPTAQGPTFVAKTEAAPPSDFKIWHYYNPYAWLLFLKGLYDSFSL